MRLILHAAPPVAPPGLQELHLSLDCPVPRLTLLFSGAAKDIPEAAKTVTAGTVRRHFVKQANGQTRVQAMLRPLKRCTTREITAMINSR
jgi:hypothetical protein